MSRSLTIAGVERWDDLELGSLQIRQELTFTIDTCSFSLKGGRPTEGEEVIIEQDGVRKFGGVIVRPELSRTFDDKSLKVYKVDCNDYTALIDRRLVVETYENKTADWIVKDIAAKYCPGFTVAGVQPGAPNVEKIIFDYVRPSECFKRLCNYVGWHWQPDYFKDIQFFNAQALATPAPLALAPGGPFVFGRHGVNTDGLRNRIYVRGGTMLSDPQTLEWKADGAARIWNLPWGPHNCTFRVGGTAKTLGIENIDEEGTKNYYLNFTEKYIRADAATVTPAAGTTLSLTAAQDIDVITVVEDISSQLAIAAIQGGDGVYEHVIVDDKLITIEAAEAAGQADLREHANPRVQGSFQTETEGWAPGQIVDIQLPDRSVSGQYLVQRVTLTPRLASPSLWTSKIDYGGRLFSIADVLAALVSAQQQKDTGATGILNKFVYGSDTAGLLDELAVTTRALPFVCGDNDAVCALVEVSDG